MVLLSLFRRKSWSSILFNSISKVFGFPVVSFLCYVYLHRSHLFHVVHAEYLLIFYLEVDFLLYDYSYYNIVLVYFFVSFHTEENIINSGFPANQIILPLIIICSLWMEEYNERWFLKYTGSFQAWLYGPIFCLVLF